MSKKNLHQKKTFTVYQSSLPPILHMHCSPNQKRKTCQQSKAMHKPLMADSSHMTLDTAIFALCLAI
jgi:hypothetical protein